MAGTIPLFVMEFKGLKSLRENDPDVDALISDLRRSLSGEDDSPIASAEQEPFSASKVLGEEDLARLAGLIAARVCAVLQKNMPDR